MSNKPGHIPTPGCLLYEGPPFDPTRTYQSKCPGCCKHDLGFWQLKEHYGEWNEKWCCLGGCGYLLTFNPEEFI